MNLALLYSIIYEGENMIYLYTDLTKKGFSDYQIKKMVKENKLYVVKKGIYSDKLNYNYLEVIAVKHPNAVFTLETAAYCYGLISKNKIPYVIATKQKDRKIKDECIKQIFTTDKLYNTGVSKITYQGFNILIYDLERLLIDIVRNKKNMDFESYYEIISNYKRISKLLNKNKLNDYIINFKEPKIVDRIKREVLN